MALGQALLDIMEDLNGELQLQTGETDVAKGLRALNAAQDVFEAVLASHPRVLGSGIGTVTTTASTESTAFPTALLRLDALWFIDPGTSRPGWKLKNLRETGGHARGQSWIASIASNSLTGRPRAYWTNGTNIYWDPLPSATHTVRWYGLQAAASITAAGTFAYGDLYMYPFAALASRIMKTTLDDPAEDMITLGRDMFNPLIDALSGFNRDGATGLVYDYSHDT